MQTQTTGSLTLPWPGLTDEGSLLLHVPELAIPLQVEPGAWVSGRELLRKRDHHVTVMNRAWGSVAERALGAATLRDLFDGRDWALHEWGDLLLVHRPPSVEEGKPEAWSIVQVIDLPAMQSFLDAVARMAGLASRQAVHHVTRYVSGAAEGVELLDGATLAQRLVRTISPTELKLPT